VSRRQLILPPVPLLPAGADDASKILWDYLSRLRAFTFDVADGVIGVDGAPGPPGADGAPGAPGSGGTVGVSAYDSGTVSGTGSAASGVPLAIGAVTIDTSLVADCRVAVFVTYEAEFANGIAGVRTPSVSTAIYRGDEVTGTLLTHWIAAYTIASGGSDGYATVTGHFVDDAPDPVSQLYTVVAVPALTTAAGLSTTVYARRRQVSAYLFTDATP
jgi:hypothetical protein